jgi:hypothetical protein
VGGSFGCSEQFAVASKTPAEFCMGFFCIISTNWGAGGVRAASHPSGMLRDRPHTPHLLLLIEKVRIFILSKEKENE